MSKNMWNHLVQTDDGNISIETLFRSFHVRTVAELTASGRLNAPTPPVKRYYVVEGQRALGTGEFVVEDRRRHCLPICLSASKEDADRICAALNREAEDG